MSMPTNDYVFVVHSNMEGCPILEGVFRSLEGAKAYGEELYADIWEQQPPEWKDVRNERVDDWIAGAEWVCFAPESDEWQYSIERCAVND